METPSNYPTNFALKAENNRAIWSAAAIMIQANVLAPLTLLSMNTYHGGDWQLACCITCFFMVVIPVLSAQPMLWVARAFLLSTSVHLAIILFNFLS